MLYIYSLDLLTMVFRGLLLLMANGQRDDYFFVQTMRIFLWFNITAESDHHLYYFLFIL